MISLSLIAAHARSASSRFGIWMKPKPLDLPLKRFITSLTELTLPNASNSARSWSSVMS